MSEARSYFCPAKINPFLAVTGRREDGFHELLSVVVPLAVGDSLNVTPTDHAEFSLECDEPTVPTDERNLVLVAAREFVAASGWVGGAHFQLQKRLPHGAGLGGGSSDAVAALIALNNLAGGILSAAEMSAVAAKVGSDCPLFLHSGPVVMRGRGEQVENLPDSVASRFGSQRLLVIKPPFGVNTAWAYGRMAALAPGSYTPPDEANAWLNNWCDDSSAGLDQLGFNSFMPVVASKWQAVSAFAELLRRQWGYSLHLSGSGSACFLWMPADTPIKPVVELAKSCWGSGIWWSETTCLAQP